MRALARRRPGSRGDPRFRRVRRYVPRPVTTRGDAQRRLWGRAAGRRSHRPRSWRRVTLAAAIAVGVTASACSSSSVTTVGGCAIAPGAACQGTYMKGGHIIRGNLFGANLSRADLRRGLLVGAILTGANLTHTNLQGADLRHAYLEDANLNQADLRGARFDRAWLAGATFVGARGVSVATLESGIVCRTVAASGVVLNRDC